jgi:plasmid replication initiation protein
MTTKLVKNKTPKVYKNKKLNNANFADFNLNDYQVFLHLVSKIGKVDPSGSYVQSETLEREHTLTASEYSRLFNVDIHTAYRVIKSACKRLMKTSIILEKPELFETWEINVCSHAKYKEREGKIEIMFTDSIMPYLAQVRSKFVLYNLKEVSNFGSFYTTRLYEYIQEFKDTGWIECSVDKLRELFAVGGKFKLYADFKRFTFGHAVNEINSQYEINLKFEEIKEQKKVTRIKFTFKHTIIRKVYNPHSGKEQNVYIKPKRKLVTITPEQPELELS